MPLKILLADDHLVLLAGMRALLEREGYQVVADVSDGRQAVNLARRLQPHIAVLDITMPGLNGLAAAQRFVGDFHRSLFCELFALLADQPANY